MHMSEKRNAQRLRLQTDGYALLKGEEIDFRTEDLSLGGSCIALPADKAPGVGSALKVVLTRLGFGADALVRWASPQANGITQLGVQFINLDFAEQASGNLYGIKFHGIAASG
jgi:hypothetical protein